MQSSTKYVQKWTTVKQSFGIIKENVKLLLILFPVLSETDHSVRTV
jgi:hypothetical protein